MANGKLDYTLVPVHLDECWKKPVHAFENQQAVHRFAAKDTERTSHVGHTIARNRVSKRVRDPRGYFADEIVPSPLSSPVDEVELVLHEVRQEPYHIGRIALAVPVEGRDVSPAGMRKPGGKGGGLPPVGIHLKILVMGVRIVDTDQFLKRPIGRPVVHPNAFPRPARAAHRAAYLAGERLHVELLVVHRYHDAHVERCRFDSDLMRSHSNANLDTIYSSKGYA